MKKIIDLFETLASFTRQVVALAITALLLICSGPAAQAQPAAVTGYRYTTLYSFAGTDTNVVGQATNIAATVTCTRFDQFNLEFRMSGTNSACTTTLGYTVAWQSSADGTNWGTVDNINRGWFSIPMTNQLLTVWHTNITLNTLGYWRVNWLTNSSAACATNMSVRAYVKPSFRGS